MECQEANEPGGKQRGDKSSDMKGARRQGGDVNRVEDEELAGQSCVA